ncbi:hypothetical protein ACFOWM_11290 [Ferruginibacter yonginensis]|uniref:Polysaccharide chain length determinant N-terminal domain-containing protein n=1 Tax=Ferruginibacter yonginensis TaxID=1310416 RepID=A0ABV8QUW6_9BACT
MTSQILIKNLLDRLNKFKFVILGAALILAVLLYFYVNSLPTSYSIKATVFPLTSGSDNSSASSRIGEILGANGANSKSITDDANVNIEEVAKSRKTREAVALVRLPQFKNKTIAEVLIDNYNKYKSYSAPELATPKDTVALAATGSSLLAGYYTVKINKNSLLEVDFTSKDKDLISPTTYVLIDKISTFYKELKIKKAQYDFDFTQRKVDSFQNLINQYDKERIDINNKSIFVPPSKLQYTVPVENLENKKLLVLAQYNNAVSNREEALWRLQKVTPIIEILDRPEPPFIPVKPSKMVYAFGGFILGLILFSLIFIADILYKYANKQIKSSIDSKLNNQTTA